MERIALLFLNGAPTSFARRQVQQIQFKFSFSRCARRKLNEFDWLISSPPTNEVKLVGYGPEAPLPRRNAAPSTQLIPLHSSCPINQTNGRKPKKRERRHSLKREVNELIEELINEAAGPTTYNLLCRNLKNEVLQ